MHTQALMTSKACLSQLNSPAPVLGVPAPVSPAQSASSCSPPHLGWGDLELWGLCYLHSHIRGGSCRGLIPVGIRAIGSEPPSSCSVRSWSAWQVQLGSKPHSSNRDRAPASGGRHWEWTETLGPDRISSQQIPEQDNSASDSPHPLPSMGLLFVTSEASCSTERRMV